MARRLFRSKRSPTRMARWKIEISVTVAVGIVLVSLIANAGDGATAHASGAPPTTFARLSRVPSHNDVYRASLIPESNVNGRFDTTAWIVEVQTTVGAPVKDAALALESWMPDDDRVLATRPRVVGYVGDGRYRIEGLRLDRRGWWNVRLHIAAPSATDSLAFNVVL